MSQPAATIAVATRDRALRLRWLLNALVEQSIGSTRFEVIVAHDSTAPDTDQLLCGHDLAQHGHLRQLRFPPETLRAAAKRNAAWRAARAPLVLFTDDDCRPAPDWVERAVAAASAHPRQLLQGLTLPDPDERRIAVTAPWARTVHVVPPTVWAETCNIAYPWKLLDRLGGFAEDLDSGEDTDLALRARQAGASIVAVPEMLVYHGVEDPSLPSAVRSLIRWQDMALLVKRHPQLRRHLWGWIWWKPQHAGVVLGLAGAIAVRRPRAAVLGLPWVAHALSYRGYGYGPRGIIRSVAEMPGRAALDVAELLVLIRGSVRHRTLLL